MQKRTAWLILLILVLIVAGGFIITILQLSRGLDQLPQGENATLAMTAEERNFFSKIQRINGGTTEAEVANILGPPIKEGGQYGSRKLEQWSCPVNDKECTIRIKFMDGRVFAIEWLKKDTFFYHVEYGEYIELETLQTCEHDDDCMKINYRCSVVGVNKDSDYEAFLVQEGYFGPCNQKNTIWPSWKMAYCEENVCKIKFDCRNCTKVNEAWNQSCDPPCIFCSSICNALESCDC